MSLPVGAALLLATTILKVRDEMRASMPLPEQRPDVI
jgi:hypothetical protein